MHAYREKKPPEKKVTTARKNIGSQKNQKFLFFFLTDKRRARNSDSDAFGIKKNTHTQGFEKKTLCNFFTNGKKKTCLTAVQPPNSHTYTVYTSPHTQQFFLFD